MTIMSLHVLECCSQTQDGATWAWMSTWQDNDWNVMVAKKNFTELNRPTEQSNGFGT